MGLKKPRSSWGIIAMRHGFPLVLVIAGIVMIVISGGHINGLSDNASESNVFVATHTDKDSVLAAIGVGCEITAAMIWLFGWLIRLSIASGKDRDKEDADREYFTRTGRWPGERGPG